MKNKEEIEEIVFAIAENERKLMITTILEHSSDEFESDSDYVELAGKNKRQLRFTLNNILKFYL